MLLMIYPHDAAFGALPWSAVVVVLYSLPQSPISLHSPL
jgi:hypothetical protein